MPRSPGTKSKDKSEVAGAAESPAGQAAPGALAGAGATLPQPGSEDALYVIDLSSYVFRAYHAIAPLSSSRGEPTHAVLGTVNMLQKVVNERRPALLAVAMDSKTATFRNEMDDRYKANRPPPPPDLSMQMDRCEQIVRAYRIPIFQGDGYEADDFIAAVVKHATEAGLRVVVVSADKDLMQLVHDTDDAVVLWDSMRDKVYGPREVQEKLGVPPSKVRDFLALTGDTSDNVPGVPSVGPKTACDLLTTFGSLEGIYEKLDAVSKPKLREALAKHKDDAFLSQRLVTLHAEVPLAFKLEDLPRKEADEDELRRLFTELEFTRQLSSLRPPPPPKHDYRVLTELGELEAFAARARAGGALAFDVETTSPDAMASVIVGLSVAAVPGEAFYVPVGHRYLGVPSQPAWEDVRRVLGPVFADPSVKKIAHELKFGAIVLANHGMPVEGAIFDTMLASYLLDPETPNALKEIARRELNVTMTTYEEVTAKQRSGQLPFEMVAVEDACKYAAADADVVLTIAGRYEDRLEREGLATLMNDVELPLSRVLEQMERTGVLVDVPRLEALARRIEEQLRSLETRAKGFGGNDFSVRSRDQLEKILFDELKLPVLKRTPKGARSTDAEVLEELAERHELPRIICDFRELDKLKGTYLEALPRYVNPKTGRIHTRFSQTTAATGRLSSQDPNLQNIPIRTELSKEIRAAFVAPPGFAIVSADYSQIELRVLAHLSDDPELVDAFRTNADIHTRTAQLVFGVASLADVTSEMRRRAKTINFGVIYGMGDSALGKSLGIPREEAARFIAAYFERYAGVARFMERTVEGARRGEAVRTLLGRRRFLPNLHSANRGLRMEAERVAKNTPIQGSAADILKIAMVRLGQAPPVPGARMVLTVHDELVFEVPEALVEEAKVKIRAVMESAMELRVPLVVDAGSGASWAEAH